MNCVDRFARCAIKSSENLFDFCFKIIANDAIYPKDEEPNKKPKHKPFYKERNGKRLKNWEK